MRTIILILCVVSTLVACKKEAEYKPVPSVNEAAPVHNHVSSNGEEAPSNELHTVVVQEIVPAARYLYLQVEENGETFWIAVLKQEVEVGKTYFYNRALLKTNFESKETNKFFDKIYLVTSLVSEDHAQNNSMQMPVEATSQTTATNSSVVVNNTAKQEIIEKEGSVKIANLVKDPKKYEGKTIQISGKCFKINPGIMDRNWIHLKDGSKDDYDLVITSQEFVAEGTVVTMKGVVTLHKDFGAGYSYDLILENGVLVK